MGKLPHTYLSRDSKVPQPNLYYLSYKRYLPKFQIGVTSVASSKCCKLSAKQNIPFTSTY